MGWPFTIFSQQTKYKQYLLSKLKKIGNYKATKWVLIEPNSNFHYGFMDAGLINFPTYDYDRWFTPSFYNKNIKTKSENRIKIVIVEEEGSKNPWARVFGFEQTGPLILNSDYPFGVSDIELLEKHNNSYIC